MNLCVEHLGKTAVMSFNLIELHKCLMRIKLDLKFAIFLSFIKLYVTGNVETI